MIRPRRFDVTTTDRARVRVVQGAIGAKDFLSRIEVDGVPAFEFGMPCGTCGVIFGKLGETSTLSDAEAVDLLGSLDDVPDEAKLRRLAAPLGAGTWEARIFEGVPRLVEPGGPGDFFVEEYGPLHGLEADDAGLPRTLYYRFGEELVEPLRLPGGDVTALLLSMIVPFQDPAQADESTVADWVEKIAAGETLTALALTIPDIQGPAVWDEVETAYPHREHRAVVHYLLDGHHRVAASARKGVPIRVLAFVGSPWNDARWSEGRHLLDLTSSTGGAPVVIDTSGPAINFRVAGRMAVGLGLLVSFALGTNISDPSAAAPYKAVAAMLLVLMGVRMIRRRPAP